MQYSEKQKYPIVGTVPKSNRKILERGKIIIPIPSDSHNAFS